MAAIERPRTLENTPQPGESTSSPSPAREPRMLPNGVVAHELTTEDRRRGAEAMHAKKRAEREEAERVAAEARGGMRLKAWNKLAELVDSAESEMVAMQAVREFLDRDLGKPAQAVEHSGSVDLDVEVTAVRERLASKLGAVAERADEPG